MATVQMLFSPVMRFMPNEQMLPTIKADLDAGLYRTTPEFEVDCEGEDAADEAFDLTNNPHRQAEREEKYGRGQSLSSGDIVLVNGKEHWVCLSFGWAVL